MYYCVYVKGDTITPVGEESIRWRIKAAEPKTRDAALPILLYHNIDGKGIFSVDSDALRSHFEMLRSDQISVIRLGDFVKKLGSICNICENVMDKLVICGIKRHV